MTTKDALELLGLKEMTDETGLKKAYRETVKCVHPDKGGNEALFRIVTEAYQFLTNPAQSRMQPSEPDSNTTAHEEPKQSQSQTNNQRPSWWACIHDPNFIMPFEALYEITRTGERRSILFNRIPVVIKLDDIWRYPIQCQIPIHVQCQQWKTIFHYLLHLPPAQTTERQLFIRNEAMLGTGERSTCRFKSIIRVKAQKGVTKVRTRFLEADKTTVFWPFRKKYKQDDFYLIYRNELPIRIDVGIHIHAA